MIVTLIVITGSFFIFGAAYQFVSVKLDKMKYPPVGEKINIGNRLLHVVCSRSLENGPTIILEAGNGLTSTSWMLVQPQITKFANCLSYDRSGFGWSDPRPGLFKSLEEIEDLHHLLLKLNMPRPYILVGHSYGGMLNQLYAREYPNEIAGIILVDAYHEKQLRIVPLPSAGLLKVFRALNIFGLFRFFIQRLFPIPSQLPSHMRNRLYAEMSGYSWITSIRKIFVSTEEILRELEKCPKLHKPLTVISAGIRSGPELKVKNEIDDLQKDLLNKSTNGLQIIAKNSTHNIPFSDPDLIVDAVHEMVKKVSGVTL